MTYNFHFRSDGLTDAVTSRSESGGTRVRLNGLLKEVEENAGKKQVKGDDDGTTLGIAQQKWVLLRPKFRVIHVSPQCGAH